MSMWYDVSIIAAGLEQQIDAALSDLEAVATDARAMMHVSQAKHAMRELALYARGEVKQPPPVVRPSAANPTKMVVKLVRRPLIVEFPTIHKQLCEVLGVDENLFVEPTRVVEIVNARRAMAYVYYYGIRWQVPVSFPQLAGLLGMSGHSSLIGQSRCTPRYAGVATARLYDVLERAQIETHPRPDWAKEAA
jgi:hypothetical protein